MNLNLKPFTPDEIKGANLFKNKMFNKNGMEFMIEIRNLLNIPGGGGMQALVAFACRRTTEQCESLYKKGELLSSKMNTDNNVFNQLVLKYDKSTSKHRRIDWTWKLNDIFYSFTLEIKNKYIYDAIELDIEKKNQLKLDKDKNKIRYLINKLLDKEFNIYKNLENESDKLDYLYKILDRNEYDYFRQIC